MKRVTVLYTRSRISGFGYSSDDPVLRNYNVEPTAKVPLSLKYYTEVDTSHHEGEDIDILNKIWHEFNTDMAGHVNHLIKKGADTSHSLMSVGDIIKIDERYYIVADMGFDELEVETVFTPKSK